jgi:hypothetical protein
MKYHNIEDHLEKHPMGSPYLKYAYNQYSQNGEDGIIKKILDELEVKKGTVVEFGAWDGIYLSNVFNLTYNYDFNSILIEGDPQKASEYVDPKGNSKMYNFLVSPDKDDDNSIDNILEKIGYENKNDDLVLMSIDIDSSDYYVLESIKRYLPIIIVIETSISYPLGSLFRSYDQGCSFDSVWELCKDMGYSIVAYTSNAILVRSDYLHKLKEFDIDSTMEKIYINQDQYLILGKINENGEILENYFTHTKEYMNKIEKIKNKDVI